MGWCTRKSKWTLFLFNFLPAVTFYQAIMISLDAITLLHGVTKRWFSTCASFKNWFLLLLKNREKSHRHALHRVVLWLTTFYLTEWWFESCVYKHFVSCRYFGSIDLAVFDLHFSVHRVPLPISLLEENQNDGVYEVS